MNKKELEDIWDDFKLKKNLWLRCFLQINSALQGLNIFKYYFSYIWPNLNQFDVA